jgi:archaellum component FlaC
MLKWVESSDILEKIHAIEQFFAKNPEMSEAIDTLIEVNNTLQELDNRIDTVDSTLQELDNRIDAVDSTVPLICNWIAEFKGKTLVEFEATNYSDAINLTAFNR